LRTLAVTALLLLAACSRAPDVDALARHRILGKAFYENPTTRQEAVREFKQALDIAPDSARDKLNYALALLKLEGQEQNAVRLLEEVQKQDPSLPHTWFNLGIYYKRHGDTKRAIAQFEGMISRAPGEAIAHFQLGALYRQMNRNREAQTQFETAAMLDPQLAAARFQLYNLYRVLRNPEQMNRYLTEFQRIQALQKTWVIPEDVEWCEYAEIYDPPADRKDDAGPADDAAPAGFTSISSEPGVTAVAPGDFDNDGLMDLCVLTETGPRLYRNTGSGFVRQSAQLPVRRFDAAVWLDYDHDYDLDLVLLGPQPALLRNQGAAGWVDRTADFPFVSGAVTDARKLRVVPDSKAFDLAVFYRDQTPVLYRDRLGGRYTAGEFKGTSLPHPAKVGNHWIRVELKGVRSLKLAQDALVEIKAGTLYRSGFYAGVPLLFDTGDHTTVDVVRITWPNGLVQNEVNQAANQAHTFVEAQRLSGSCPMIWCWNGHGFEFVADVLGVAPLGASSGDAYFPVDHDEYVQIPAAALRPKDGKYQIRVTEELSEVSYLDQIELYAVDHPAGTEIFTNEKFQGPPYPDLRLFSVNQRIYPRAASENGADVLPQLLAKDHRYPDGFSRSETGLADMHTLELDFGHAAPSGKALLLLNGWVDWPDGSTFRRASQESSSGLTMPYLEAQDAAGIWKIVNRDMGMPPGKPRTIAVPVEFPSGRRKLRIVTNFCIYWDEIFLSEDISDAGVTLTRLPLESAGLHFRGFSESRIDPRRKQPDTFFYGQVSPASFWNPTPGLYTRYGPVDALLRDVDDRFAILGSGDELSLEFQADAAQRGPRDFLLKVDGWAKDSDPNTAFPGSVEPLPFHAMSRYPYPPGEHYPRDEEHDNYRREYNTRPARNVIPALRADE
jgi:tetratricopeptide (TPR) repeat protein